MKNTFEFTELVTLNLLKIRFNERLFILDGSGHVSCTWHHSDACRHSKVKLENNETDSIQLNRPGKHLSNGISLPAIKALKLLNSWLQHAEIYWKIKSILKDRM